MSTIITVSPEDYLLHISTTSVTVATRLEKAGYEVRYVTGVIKNVDTSLDNLPDLSNIVYEAVKEVTQ
jgi:hypothetical protein